MLVRPSADLRSAPAPPPAQFTVAPPGQRSLWDPDPPRLLTLTAVQRLFMARLGIADSTYYEGIRPWLPVVHTRNVRVRGQSGVYRPGSPRVREDMARALLDVAASGQWQAYCEGRLRESRPDLYLPA